MVVSFALSLLSAAAFPQCNLAPVASAQFRSSILDLAVDGNDLWAATSYGVTLYDRSVDPPLIVSSVAVPGTTRVIRAGNGVAYAGSGSAIFVIRKSPRGLVVSGSVDAGGTVNDLVLRTNDLFAATANGIAQFDLLKPDAPARTPAILATSGSNVTSIALSNNNTLFAADGDASVEVFDVSIATLPQRTGSVTSSLARPSSVHASGGRLYVSDGQNTEAFIGSGNSLSPAATLPSPFGSTSLAPFSASAIFVAGTDRRLRAFDVTTAGNPIEVFRNDLSPAGGTINRITSMVAAGSRLYVGAGDIGLSTWDIGSFAAPFPLRAYSGPATTSVVTLDNKVYLSRATGGLSEFTQTNGALTQARTWDGSRVDVVHDGDANTGFLLTSSGATATMWSLTSTNPSSIATATFRGVVSGAALIGTTGYAVLADHTLWSADFSQAQPQPQQIAVNAKPSFLARSGSSIVLAELRDDGTTALYFFATADFNSTPAPISVPGVATSGVTLSGKTAAVWTFRGLTLADFSSGSTTLLPQSNAFAARALSLSGTTLVEVTFSALIQWDTAAARIVNQFTLPSTAVAVQIAGQGKIANLATADGVTSVLLFATSKAPTLLGVENPNAYYKEVTAAAGHVDLIDSRGVDIFTSRLHFVGSVRTPGFLDAAASDRGLYTVGSNLQVSAYTPDGIFVSSTTINEGTDALALSIATSNDAVWVSIRRGCPSNCENKTLVFDARNGVLTQTASFAGAVRDTVTAGTTAYVLTELPNEVRVLDVTDPYHPQQRASRASAAQGARTPVAIGADAGTVYVIGDRLDAYAEKDLNPLSTTAQFPLFANDPSTGVTYIDQHFRIDGGCATLTGRSFSPQLFKLQAGSWSSTQSFTTPSAARSLAAVPGTVYVLTDHSLEVWSSQPLPPTARRRATR